MTAYDIDGNRVHVGDYVVTTEEGLRKLGRFGDGWHAAGEVFQMEAIYRYQHGHLAPGAEIVGTLRSKAAYTWNSDLRLYRRVDHAG